MTTIRDKAEETAGAPSMTIDDLLSLTDGGRCSVEASRALRELLRINGEVAEDYGTARCTLTIKLTLSTVKQGGQTEVGYSITPKPAEVPTQKTVLYLTDGNRLTDRDPRQQEMNFRGGPSSAGIRQPKTGGN